MMKVGCAVLFVSLLLSSKLMAVAGVKKIEIAQQPASTQRNISPDQQKAYTRAKQLNDEAQQLQKQGTAESQQQALTKYEEALKLWRQLGVNEPPPQVARNFEATTLLSIGTLYLTQSEPQKALSYFNQGLVIRRELKDPLGEALMLSSLGTTYSNLNEKQKAILFYNQALSIFQAEKKPSLAAQMLSNIGGIYFDLGQTQTSIAFYNQALEMQRTDQDTATLAHTLQALGRIYAQYGEPQKALALYNEALKIQRTRKDLAEQAEILSTIGFIYSQLLSDNQKGLLFLNDALTLQRAAQGKLSGIALAFNLSREAQILISIAATYKSLGNYPKTLDLYNRAISLLQKAGNRSVEAEILNQISFAYDELGEKQKALCSLNQALMLQRASKDSRREAFTLNNIAGIYASLSDYQKALDFYNQALVLQRQVKDRPQEAVTLKDIASVYSLLGDYQLSIDTYNQALEISKQIGDRTTVARTLDNIGTVYRSTPDYQKSLDYYNQALKLWREQGDKFNEFGTLTGVIRVYESLKNYPQAMATANEALSLSRQQKSSFAETAALALLGKVHLASGDYQLSLSASNQAVSGWHKLGSRIAEANVLGNIGKAYNSLKQPQQAINTYNQELKLRRTLGDRTGEADTLYNIAVTERDRGNLNGALSQIETTIKIVEDVRTKVTSQDLRTSYFASVQKYYQFYIDLLMRLHKQQPSKGYDSLALNASERARARSLLELLNEANADIRAGVNPKLLELERTLQQQIDARLKRQIELSNNQNSQALETEIAALLEQVRQVQAQIRTTSPRYAALTQPQPLKLAEIQQQVLDDNTLLLEYSLGEERSYLWAVTKTNITSYELPKREDIEAATQKFRDALTIPSQRTIPEAAKAADPLSEILLTPVAKQLGHKRLVVVSDGALQYIPFAALTSPNSQQKSYEPLINAHEIITLPSASTIALLRHEHQGRKRSPKKVAVLADPVFSPSDERVKHQSTSEPSTTHNSHSLPELQLSRAMRESGITFDRLRFTRQEAEQILSLVPPQESQTFVDFAASRTTATSQQLQQYRIIHFATHGILNSKHPELSGVVLSLVDETGKPQNGFLRLQDVFNLNLSAELVVLSACETGLGEEVKGEGIVGLTRGFMYAGSPRVVVSLWSVDDQGTSELMKIFYTKMWRQGLQPAAALRAAQIEMWRNQNFAAPYYWAAFTLQGEWN